MTPDDVGRIEHGLYVVLWMTGGYSLAAVGSDGKGRRWIAPTNWISGPSFDWTDVRGVVPVLMRTRQALISGDVEVGDPDDELDVAIDAWMVGDATAVSRLGHSSPSGLLRLAERLHRRGAINEARALYQEVSCLTPGIGTLVSVFGIAMDIARHWDDQNGVNAALIDRLVRAVTSVAIGETA